MLDRSFLPAADFEFVVIADTHYMLDPAGQQVEFNSRRRQTARTEHALQRIAGINGAGPLPLIVHMGDLIQEFPEQPAFAQARDEALAQLARHNIAPRLVAGNHDVGDKPDPTMPASWVTPEFLADYHARFGLSWYSWGEGGLHFVVLNSQIMNSALPEAATQEAWLEDNLTQHAGKRIFLFLHLPPFIHDATEPHLGHYDNLGEPARGRLLDLVRRHQVERIFAAHIHWAFYNQIDQTRFQTVPSVAFTRPGFSELFSSAPPAEQGRDDVDKLGFFLVRVHKNDSRVHFLRTGGNTDPATPEPIIVTGTSTDLPHSPLGIVARHPLTSTGQVPSAWPSTIRQRVRNDYGLLSALELGVRHLRVPLDDLVDPVQRERLAYLRAHGLSVTAQWLYEYNQSPIDAVAEHAHHIDGIDLALLGSPWPEPDAIHQLQDLAATGTVPLSLSCVIPGHKVVGKQHNRSQIGYRADQLVELNQWLATHDLRIARAACRLDGSISKIVKTIHSIPDLSHIGALDWLYTIPTGGDQAQMNGVAAALFALCQRPQDRLFIEPFVTLDRTMDSGPGLLDRAYNPNPTFHLLRHLNTLLYHQAMEPADSIAVTEAVDHIHLSTALGNRALSLILPTVTSGAITPSAQHQAGQQVTLISGIRQPWSPSSRVPITEPTLLYGTI